MARKIGEKMKEHYLKKSHQYVSIIECAEYLGLKYDEVEKVLF